MFSQCVANTVDGLDLICYTLQDVKVLFFPVFFLTLFWLMLLLLTHVCVVIQLEAGTVLQILRSICIH